jgi:4-hydroxybenzoyl-CoA thioesterase
VSFTPAGKVAHQVVRLVPFTFRRRVAWGDSDTARIVYTARFLDFVMDACDAWWQAVTGYDWHALNVQLERGGPAVHVDMDFARAIRPGDELDCVVRLAKLGTSSVALAIAGETADGPCFSANLVSAFIDTTRMKSTPLPPGFRSRIEHYRQACEATTLQA